MSSLTSSFEGKISPTLEAHENVATQQTEKECLTENSSYQIRKEKNDAVASFPTISSSSPKKKRRKIQPYHRIKAHTNPLADKALDYPLSPVHMDWCKLFGENNTEQPRVEIADIGCGYGGFLVKLSAMFPSQWIVGIEIREKVVDYVQQRLDKLRSEHEGAYRNIAILKTNAMKYMPNYFRKGQLKKIFFLFPDPHFKKANQRRRIISPQLLAEYAFVLEKGGTAYTVTDVEDLHQWMVSHFTEHPLFERVDEKQLEGDPVIPLVLMSSEESRKVDKANGKKLLAVFRRRDN